MTSGRDRGRASSLSILLACYEYPPIGGGGGVGARQYAEAWAAAGHSVTVLTGRGAGLPARQRVAGVDVVRVGAWGRRDRATSTVMSMLSYVVYGLAHLLAHRRAYRDVDVVNTHFALPTGPLGLGAARLLGVPQVLTIIGGDIYDPSKRSSPHRHGVLRLVNRMLLRASDEVVAISTDTRGRAREHYGLDRRIRVINYGYEPPDVAEIPRIEPPGKENAYRLVAVGRLIRRKGFDHLIRALALLPEDVELLVIGDGPEEEHLRRTAADAGVRERVHFLGYRERRQIYGYLRAADCFVLSSLHEGLGIVVQEAMWAGLPVVATDNGGQVDLLRDGRNGFLVPVGDSGAMAGAIGRLRGDPGQAERMAEANREDIRAYYVAENSKRYIELFGELLDNPGVHTLESAHGAT